MAQNTTIPPSSDKVREILVHEDLSTPASTGAMKDRSADITPAIQSTEDLERVTSETKPTAPPTLSREAKQQIAPKLNNRRAA